MTGYPAPPVPSECTMEGNDWFPFFFDRLRKSKWWRRASDLARARNVMMWGEAYKAVPAGSLPDDDDELAEAAGFGMDAAAFIAAKAEIMAPWTLCSDGRWYHPTICEVALDAWERKSERRKLEAQKKRDQRDKARGVPVKTASVPANTPDVPGDTTLIDRDIGTQTDRTTTPQPPRGSLGTDDALAKAQAAYPEAGRVVSTEKLSAAWAVAVTFAHPATIAAAVPRYAASAAATVSDGRRVPRLDRWLRDRLWEQFVDRPQALPDFPGPPDLKARAVALKGEAWTRSWLDPCGWRDLPEPAVIARNEEAARRLLEHVGGVLADFSASVIIERPAAA